MNRLSKLALIALALISSSAFALTDQEIKQIVLDNFPSSLVDDYTQESKGGTYTDTVADFNGDGTSIIAAAYTNGETVLLRMIGTDGSILDTGNGLPPFDGAYIKLETHDFDGDGRPELVLSTFGGAVASAPTENWIFKWTGSSLQLVSPTETFYGDILSKFHDSAFDDLDQDGKTEVIMMEEPERGPKVEVTYEWEGNRFVKASELVFFKGFNSFSGSQRSINEHFAAPDPGISYRFIVSNGVGGKRLATSATLTLNGNALVGSGEFNRAVPKIEKTIKLQSNNVLTGQFQGNPDGFIQISVEQLLSTQASPATPGRGKQSSPTAR